MCLVMVVEDNVVFRRSFVEMLQGRFPEIRIEEAGDGADAMNKLLAALPDLVFTDIRLPGENGLEVARRIKNVSRETRVGVLTSYDLPEYREAAYKNGADYFFVKWETPRDEIFKVVASVISALNQV